MTVKACSMRLLVLGIGLSLSHAAPAADAPTVASLEWLSGRWVSDNGKTWTEENWSSPRGGMLLGNSKQGQGNRTAEFELLRISPDDKGVVTYWASPAGRPPTPFALVSSEPNHAVFENPAHDYPTRIEYRRDGKNLTATISGPGGADPMSWHHRRVGD